MLLSAVSVLVVAQSSSEIPEGLMNNPVFSELIGSYTISNNISINIYINIEDFINLNVWNSIQKM